ncbi:glycoside hydrolase family 78 protein [Tessaracoccus sp. OS52]|uniref:alpha-L-rhamnosidase n=1 Tax=Tessaracoccus sp. OS52 TaxID=2886691 RepID=UPI001D11CA27|nr:alpha-L-rhamnosidase [Tessaracoccus sp. OS52]MCC2592575.1 glycoside hydrolase family 78 protein [Tessaracoccus sp. OS52]
MSLAVDPPRLEYGLDSHLVPVPAPRLSWVVRTNHADWRQRSAEVKLTSGGEEATAGIAGDESVFIGWPFEALSPRQRGEVRVRVEGPQGWSDWSDPTPFLTSFLAPGEWLGQFVGLPAPAEHAQPLLLRRDFSVGSGLLRANWYATAQGTYQTWFNGSEVDDQILKPGWTSYQYRMVHDTTDVTHLLTEGENAVGIALAGGWFTERYGFQGQASPFYGTQPAVAGQLCLEYLDGRVEWLSTDETWRCDPEGPWVAAGIYLGEDYDARRAQAGWNQPGFDAAGWVQPELREAAGPTPQARNAPVVRVTGTVAVKDVLTSPTGALLLDFGQNLVGRLRIRVNGEAGQRVSLRHAEVLEAGELGVRPLRVARASDNYILSGEADGEQYAPTFTFHGFRYAEITGWPGEFDPSDVVAEVVGSDMQRTGWFECSDPLVNRLHENVVWGMRGNFLYIPTDCPQRDERLGWTGDIQIFAPTASFLYDCDSFLASWLKDLALEQQAADGSVPFTVPDVLGSARVPAAAWGDAATIVPRVLFDRFGDRAVLEEQYPSMKAWVDLLLGLAGERYLWEGGFQFGDWVDPDSPPEDPARAKTDADLVASAFLFRSTALLAETAELLGISEDARHYGSAAEKARQAWLREYVTPSGRIVSDAQTAYALAIEFGIAQGELRSRLGDRLGWLARRDGYRISTGFVGTPLVTDALTHTGHLDQAARMLFQTECPSWLYSVLMGATTIWERWDSLLPDGSINPGEMTSFNHYALGAVADWLHREVAGIAAVEPGHRRVRIAPHPLPGLEHASARFDGPYGRIEVAWRRDGVRVVVDATVPANSGAVVRLPERQEFHVGSGKHQWVFDAPIERDGSAPLGMDTPLAEIIDDQDAYQAVVAAFDAIAPHVGEDFRRRTRWIPNQPLSTTVALLSTEAAKLVTQRVAEFNSRRGI